MKTRSALVLTLGSWMLSAACGGAPARGPVTAAARAEPPPLGIANLQPASPASTDTVATAAAPAAQAPPVREAEPKEQVRFEWSDRPTLAQAPSDAAYVSMGGRALKARHVEVDFDPKKAEWRFNVRTDDDQAAVTLTFRGKPAVGTLSQRMGANGDVFQSASGPMSANDARAVEITSIDPPRLRGVDGSVSGRFVVVFEAGAGRRGWAAGTFVAAPYVVY